MKSQIVANSVKNALSTVFLLAGAFFVCSTMLSIRSVFADPIAPVDNTVYANQYGRNTNARSGRASPRNRANPSRTTVARTSVAGGVTNPRAAATSRAVTSRATGANTNAAPSRNVVSRASAVTTRANANRVRTVRARTATTEAANNARVSLQGSAIRGSKSVTPNTAYSYLSGKLYTGNYSNIIDSTTGLISSDAYSNCMESYYTCMDEICTARNAAQRRCACAGRVKAFAEAESALETANEELIKVSGELALLIANKGKDVSQAFQLTDAEKVMNCVSWQEVTNRYGQNRPEAVKWCSDHGIYENGKEVSTCTMPSYCSTTGNNFGFDVTKLDGSGSDILASLQAWADAKENTITILDKDDDKLLGAFENLSGVVSGLGGFAGALDSSDELKDSLAETWGYELFEYAHNNVCARVLDSCFNGIYEACGTPPSGTKCSNGAGQCPYNYNSVISVDNDSGKYELNFIKANSGYSASNSAVCFGYTSTSGDPYSSLRGPVADARRSIMQKYALDANADCDAYGEQLRTTAQNINYQKIAAQQALQQKRLDFATEEAETVLANAIAASTNFNNCLSEVYDCYETQRKANDSWTTARIKTYCAQVANVPSCYEEMICNPSMAQFKAVIDKADSASCKNSQDYTQNTCRNVVTLNEIINGTGVTPGNIDAEATGNSAAMREQCMRENGVQEIRDWTKENGGVESRCTVAELAKVDPNAYSGVKNGTECIIRSCNAGYTLANGKCVKNETDCTSSIENAASAVMSLDNNGTWSTCTLVKCLPNYKESGNTCVAATQTCHQDTLALNHATAGTQTWTGSTWSNCEFTACESDYGLVNGKCVKKETDCTSSIENAASAVKSLNNDGTWSTCTLVKCLPNYKESGNTCVAATQTCHQDTLALNHATAGTQTWTGSTWSKCEFTACESDYDLVNGKCVKK